MILPNLKLRGFMAIPAPSDDPDKQRQPFRALHTLFNTAKLKYPQLDTLSMGMSADLEMAVAEGAYDGACWYRHFWASLSREPPRRHSILSRPATPSMNNPETGKLNDTVTHLATSGSLPAHIGFVGTGNMATAIMGGLLAAGYEPDQISGGDPSDSAPRAMGRSRDHRVIGGCR